MPPPKTGFRHPLKQNTSWGDAVNSAGRGGEGKCSSGSRCAAGPRVGTTFREAAGGSCTVPDKVQADSLCASSACGRRARVWGDGEAMRLGPGPQARSA